MGRWRPAGNDSILRGLPTSEARLQLLRTQSALSTLERQVAIEASRALGALQAALEGLAPRERGIEAAREAWRVRQNLFRAGKATSTDVLNAELLNIVGGLDVPTTGRVVYHGQAITSASPNALTQ